ncbi:hypothetical protein EON80_17190 [bacterium]|nr:MAG: hypothetical protein EON80_17190 [bacterium]
MALGEFLTALGYLTGVLVLHFEARCRNLVTPGMRTVALTGLVAGVIGARLSEWLLGWTHLLVSQPGAFLDPRNGGKSLVGGLIFGWLGVEIAKRRLGITRSTGDLWALALPAGEAVGRLGCFFNSCCFGTSFHGPWSVWQMGEWRHPTQLYSSLSAALIFGLLWKLKESLPREGDLFRLYLLLYGISRAMIEFYRQRDFVFANLSMVQLICIETAIVAAIVLSLSFRNNRRLVPLP